MAGAWWDDDPKLFAAFALLKEDPPIDYERAYHRLTVQHVVLRASRTATAKKVRQLRATLRASEKALREAQNLIECYRDVY